MKKEVVIILVLFIFVNVRVFAQLPPPNSNLQSEPNGDVLPPPLTVLEHNVNNSHVILKKQNISDLTSDEVAELFGQDWNCAPWTRCINDQKVLNCYNPSEDKYKTETMNCSPHCSDGKRNFDETDVDCGGSCSPCVDGKNCNQNTDCYNLCNGVCFSLKRADIIKYPKKIVENENYNYLLYAILIPIFIFLLFWFHKSYSGKEPKQNNNVKSYSKKEPKQNKCNNILTLIKEAESLISENRITEAKEKYKMIKEFYNSLTLKEKKSVEHKIVDLYYELLPGFDDFMV